MALSEKNKDFRDRDLYVYCFSLSDGNITAYQSPIMIGTDVKELKVPPNNPVGQRAYDAVAKAAEGEIVSFTYDFPKPGTKALAPKETLEVRIGKQACGVSEPNSTSIRASSLSMMTAHSICSWAIEAVIAPIQLACVARASSTLAQKHGTGRAGTRRCGHSFSIVQFFGNLCRRT